MPSIKGLLRSWLKRRGYLLTRIERENAQSLPEFLSQRRNSDGAPESAVCLDNDTATQNDFLRVFPADRVTFACPLSILGVTPADKTVDVPPAPTGIFLVEADLETFSVGSLLAGIPWLGHAADIILRVRLGAFWHSELDLRQIVVALEEAHFDFVDVVGEPGPNHLQAPAGSVFLAFRRGSRPLPPAEGARYRVTEALTYLSRPIAVRGDFQLLAGRGSFGFAAGVFNPGAFISDGKTRLLARADRTPWAIQKTAAPLYFASTQPVLLTLREDHSVSHSVAVSQEGMPDPPRHRHEDFRVFEYRGSIYTNHSVTSYVERDPTRSEPLRLDDMQTRVGLSCLDPVKGRLTWKGFPKIDRALARIEKNWAIFTDGDRVFLLYSFAPFILLSARGDDVLEFTTILEAKVEAPCAADGAVLRNSINPVLYDDRHWLHVVHRVFPDKQYAFWAVLIDRTTLLPTKVSGRPLARGWHSYPASILYLCSALAGPHDVRFFSGLDDSATAVATVPRTRLDAEWVDIDSTLARVAN